MYRVEFNAKASKMLKKLDKVTRDKIIKYLQNDALLENPMVFGKQLSHSLKTYWRYRVEKYRILCEIKNEELIILVVSVGHRNDVYEDETL